jgi:hypothetical protein
MPKQSSMKLAFACRAIDEVVAPQAHGHDVPRRDEAVDEAPILDPIRSNQLGLGAKTTSLPQVGQGYPFSTFGLSCDAFGRQSLQREIALAPKRMRCGRHLLHLPTAQRFGPKGFRE